MSDFSRDVGALDFLTQLSEGLDHERIEISRKLVNYLFVLMRSAAMHDLENEALNRPLEQMSDTLAQCFSGGLDKVEIALLDGNFFINGRLLQLDFSTFENTRYLRKISEYLDIAEISFSSVPSSIDLRALLDAFVRVLRGDIDSIKSIDLNPIYVGDRTVENFVVLLNTF